MRNAEISDEKRDKRIILKYIHRKVHGSNILFMFAANLLIARDFIIFVRRNSRKALVTKHNKLKPVLIKNRDYTDI